MACASEGDVGSDKGTLPEDPQKISSTSQAITTSEIMARADEYIAAKVPYCGGVRGGTDYICGGTCVRPAAPWDAYRSDCSGFVSWCWQIASDPTTSVLMTDRTGSNGWTTIKIDDLSAGDAVVCDGHVKLFSKFVSATSAEIYEEYDCGKVGRKAVQSFTRSGDTIKFAYDTRVYHAIRRNGLTPSVLVKGYLDSADTKLTGWAVDMNSKATHLGVDLYVDGDPGKGFKIHATADVARPDVATAIGVDPNHGYSVATPLYFCDDKAHTIAAFATPADGKSAAVALAATPKSLTCPIPPALPGVLRHVVDPTSLASWHFDPTNQLRWVTPADRDAYVKAGDLPAKPTLKRTADGRVWLIDDTYKRHVKDPASFTAWGFDDKSVVDMTDTEAAAFVDGIDLPSAPVLVQAVDGPAVYLLDGAEPSPSDPTPVSPSDPTAADPGSNGATPGTPSSQRTSEEGDMQGSCTASRAPARGSLGALFGSAFALAFLARRRRRD
ncbi:MAG: hypothetical protein ACXWUG_18550 [Polyangiales bacterium]